MSTLDSNQKNTRNNTFICEIGRFIDSLRNVCYFSYSESLRFFYSLEFEALCYRISYLTSIKLIAYRYREPQRCSGRECIMCVHLQSNHYFIWQIQCRFLVLIFFVNHHLRWKSTFYSSFDPAPVASQLSSAVIQAWPALSIIRDNPESRIHSSNAGLHRRRWANIKSTFRMLRMGMFNSIPAATTNRNETLIQCWLTQATANILIDIGSTSHMCL